MNKNYAITGQTMVDPGEVKYYLHRGRWETTISLNGKKYRKAHLVYAYHYHLTLETIRMLTDLKYVIHHLNGDEADDSIGNLKLIKNDKHMSLHKNGKSLPLEHRHKLSEALKGNKRNLGKTHSLETRRKIGEAQKGNKYSLGRIPSLETRQKMSESQKGNRNSLGKSPSLETRKKISEANTGKKLSAETRQKMSEARKRFYAQKEERKC